VEIFCKAMNTNFISASAVGKLCRFFVIFLTEKFCDSMAFYSVPLLVQTIYTKRGVSWAL